MPLTTKQKPPERVKPHSSLRAWRQAKGLTQREAADFLGVTQSCYCKWERHEQAPRRKQVGDVMARTGVPIDELMGVAS